MAKKPITPLEASYSGAGSDYLQTRLRQLEEARAKALDEKGLKPFFTLPVGDTTAFIDLSVEPRLTSNGKNTYRIKTGGKEFDMPMTAQLEIKVLKLIQTTSNTKLIFTRVGTGQTDTRYSVRVA